MANRDKTNAKRQINWKRKRKENVSSMFNVHLKTMCSLLCAATRLHCIPNDFTENQDSTESVAYTIGTSKALCSLIFFFFSSASLAATFNCCSRTTCSQTFMRFYAIALLSGWHTKIGIFAFNVATLNENNIKHTNYPQNPIHHSGKLFSILRSGWVLFMRKSFLSFDFNWNS